MIEVRYEIAGADGRKGMLRVAGGIWSGDQCVFEFADTVAGIAGTATCDWRCPAPRLDVHDGDASTPFARKLLAQLATLLAPFHRGAFADVDDRALRALYDGDYHHRMNLANGNANETAFKQHMLAQLFELGPLGKVLDAGCSAGEVVRQLRARGVDAHGFDLCEDLARIAYPEVAPFLRQGSVDAIPFGPEDGFDTVIALDVFEHVPERTVPAMVAELARLGARRLVAHIALVEFQYPGHLTLRPMSWWDRQLAPHFVRVTPPGFANADAGFSADPGRYLRVYELVGVPAACGPVPNRNGSGSSAARVVRSRPPDVDASTIVISCPHSASTWRHAPHGRAGGEASVTMAIASIATAPPATAADTAARSAQIVRP